jgi:hypothetical protein
VPGANGTTITEINDRGQMVGLHGDPNDPTKARGFLLDKGRFTSFDVLGAPITAPFGLDNFGRVVGFTIPDPTVLSFRGFLLAKGVKGAVVTVAVPGSVSATATGIDDLGRIVGSFDRSTATTDPQPGGPDQAMPALTR